jgi:hypothetical protein
MSRNLIKLVVFLVGLAAVCWIGAGYVGSNSLALTVTVLIGVCYLTGALELRRYSEATASLARAVAKTSGAPVSVAAWLEPLHPGLRTAVRLRIEGERVALPGPSLAPYLVGLLVLLGMLGTLLGMVATLHGTGTALQSASDLQAIRASLAVPVKGLAFAFGTSIAGVATSAMLGLLSALCRRDRIQAAQMLDGAIGSTLRIFSQAHQREETFRLLQRQVEVMPVLVDRLQNMMAAIETQNLATNERQIASQDTFHTRADATVARLACAVEQSLRENIADSTRVAGAALLPIMEATMAGIAGQTAALHTTVTDAVQRQLDGLSSGLAAATTTVAGIWTEALAEHRRSSEALALDLRTSLDGITGTFGQRSVRLLDDMSARLDATAASLSAQWNQALTRQESAGEKLACHNRDALVAAAATFEQHSASLLLTVGQSHADWQAELAARDQQRLAAWSETLNALALTLSREWEHVGTRTASRQQEICDTLAQTALDISAQTQAHASDTIAEVSRLVQVASEAPRAAAEVVAELRERLTESLARDTAVLAERSRLLQTLETLLDAVNHASTQQRSAVDALVGTSAELLHRVSTRFTDKLETETGKLGAIAAQVTGSAVEVASLGEAFGAAVQLFGASNDKLVTHLQRVETALDKSVTRGNEQLAYYVAQAKEVIDLSMMSQKQIVEDIQALASQRALAGAGVEVDAGANTSPLNGDTRAT